MLFDTHAHYDDEKFDIDRSQILEKVYSEGVSYIINASSDEKSISMSLELAERYPFVYAAVGIHPQSAGDVDDGYLKKLYEHAKHEKVVAIGEIGLDY